MQCVIVEFPCHFCLLFGTCALLNNKKKVVLQDLIHVLDM